MTSILEAAENYESPETKNISELPDVSVDVELRDGKGKDADGAEFQYKYVEVNGERFRVAGPVLGQLKTLKEEKPGLRTFKVKKTGTGLQTRYQVIPLG